MIDRRTAAQRVLDREIAALTVARDRISGEINEAVELVGAGPVVVTGIGKSGHIARKIGATLTSLGVPAPFLHPTDALHGDVGLLAAARCVIVVSLSGESDEIAALVTLLPRPVVAITTPGSLLARHADAVLDSSVAAEADDVLPAPTCSTTVALALGDALALTVANNNGFTRAQFARNHPGGALGRRLATTEA